MLKIKMRKSKKLSEESQTEVVNKFMYKLIKESFLLLTRPRFYILKPFTLPIYEILTVECPDMFSLNKIFISRQF